MERLKRETLPLHAQLERQLGLPRDGYSVGEHRSLLARFLGFHAPWERAMYSAGYPLRDDELRSPLLRNDLAALGMTSGEIAALPECDALPVVDTTPRQVGSMYVIEGSALGGATLAHWLERSLGLADNVGYSYYRPYGTGLAERWRAFRESATRQVSGNALDDAVSAANATFRLLGCWLAGIA